jgi:nickel-dependent lactate racemase
MSSLRFEVPAWEWYGWKNEKLNFPDGWNIHEQRMKGHDARPLTQKEIAEKLQHPVGTQTLLELSRGRNKAVIIFDDMTRPTKTWQLLPTVLNELHAGGITDDNIVFVMAQGAHGARRLKDFQKKLGEDVPERYLVFNHNAFTGTTHLGETSRGTPVHVNREVMSCDLKVSVGAIIPHFGYGFGGGSKMLLPGVAGIETITLNHGINEGTGPGMVEENSRRLDSEEAARMAGFDFSVNVLVNANCDASELVCGDIVDAHKKGVGLARRHYSTPVVRNVDVSIGNGYPMANEGYKAYHVAVELLKEDGDLVFLAYTPEGCRVHYYNGRFGTDYGGPNWSPDVYVKRPWKMERVFVVSPHMTKADEYYYGNGAKWVKKWDEALRLLEETHGNDTEVALYPCGAMQISETNAGKV